MNIKQKLNLMHVEFDSRATVGSKVLSMATNVSRESKSAVHAVIPPLSPDNFQKTITDIIKTGYNFTLCMIYSRLYTHLNSKLSHIRVASINQMESEILKSVIYMQNFYANKIVKVIDVPWLSLLHTFNQLSLNSDSAQVQTLLAACRRFAMVRISDNGPGWK